MESATDTASSVTMPVSMVRVRVKLCSLNIIQDTIEGRYSLISQNIEIGVYVLDNIKGLCQISKSKNNTVFDFHLASSL